MLEQASVEEMFQKYGEMLYKICIVMLKNTYDAEDTVQDARGTSIPLESLSPVLGILLVIWVSHYIPSRYLYQKAMSWKAK